MKSDHARNITIGAVLAILGPAIGIAGTIWGMVGAFEEMGHEKAAQAEVLSGEISKTLYSTSIGILIGMVGLVFLVVGGCQWYSNRKQNQK